jgi:ABC-2 type transport system ATP-binding protein
MSKVALEIKSLSKSFGDFKAVDDLSIDVMQGEIFSLLGPNGAGKTTTIHIISGMLGMDEGTIKFNATSHRQGHSSTHKIGVCTQNVQIWPLLTCEEQLHFVGSMYGMSKKEIKSRAITLLEMVGLSQKRRVLAKHLSGGMQRRLHLIMSVMHDPEIVIFDEPEAGLDPQSRVLVRDFIKSLAGAKTILLTTHNMDEAERLSSRVAIMDKGKILLCDTPARLQQQICPEETLEILYLHELPPLQQWDTSDYHIQLQGKSIKVTGTQLTTFVPQILQKVEAQYGTPVTFSLRQSTLEDVFIKLTGRSLRE